MLGPVIAGAHVATFWMWMMIAILSTLHAHSGAGVLVLRASVHGVLVTSI